MGFTNYIQQIKDSSNVTHDLVDSSASHYVKGTQTSSTNTWTGALPDGVTAYYDGLAIDYFLPYAGTSTAATLNLGSKGAKPVYIGNGTTQVTTHYPQYSVIHLTYVINSGLNSGNGCWKADAFYNTNSGGTITKVQTTAGAHSTINVSSGAASFNVPTKTSHLTNDSGFITSDTRVAQAYSTTDDNYPILMTATAGISSTASRGNTTTILNNQIYANPADGMIAAKHGKFTFLETEDLQTNTATVMGMLDVKGELHTNKWTSTNIANVGGSFYISPTYKTATAKFQFIGGSANSRTFKITGSFGSSSSSGLGVTAWTENSIVLVTGSVTYNNTTYPLGTCKGALYATLSTTVATIKTVDSEALEMLYSIFQTTEVDAVNIEISLLTIGGTKPVGILLTSFGTSQSTYLDIYGGTNSNTGTPSVPNADPNLRIGYLDGLTGFTAGGISFTPTGWGIYTDKGYFKGTVVADSGVIGGCTISDGLLQVPTARITNFSANAISAVTGTYSMLSSGVITTKSNRTTYDSSLQGLTLDMNGIGAGNGTSNTFKVIADTGVLYARGADITGKVVATSFEAQGYSGSTLMRKAIVDSTGLKVTDASNNTLASFGTTATIGQVAQNCYNILIDNSSGISLRKYDQTTFNVTHNKIKSSIQDRGDIFEVGYTSGKRTETVTLEVLNDALSSVVESGPYPPNTTYKAQFNVYLVGYEETPIVLNTTFNTTGINDIQDINMGSLSWETRTGWNGKQIPSGSITYQIYIDTPSSGSFTKLHYNFSVSSGLSISSVGLNLSWETGSSNEDQAYLILGSRAANTFNGVYSSSFGNLLIASGNYSHAEGNSTVAIGEGSHAEGGYTTAKEEYSHAEGSRTIASGKYGSHAEGRNTQASGESSHVEGLSTTASGNYGSHAEGMATTASGNYGSHAEGMATTASNLYSHAEGRSTIASGQCSHAEGGFRVISGTEYYTVASGDASHAEGTATTASGQTSHSEGYMTIAGGTYSHAQGYCTTANGFCETVIGRYNVLSNNTAQTSYNTSNSPYILVLGNGTGDGTSRSNAFTVDWSGNVNIKSGAKYKINGTALSASDVGAVPTSRTINSKALSSDISLTASDVGAVPTSRTINSKALSSDISLTASDIGLQVTTPTISISTTTGTLNAYTIRQYGNIIQLHLQVRNSASTAAGGNLYSGTISTTALRPIMTTTSATYYDKYPFPATISTAGAIVVRNASTTAFAAITGTNYVNVSFTYIVA